MMLILFIKLLLLFTNIKNIVYDKKFKKIIFSLFLQ